MGRPPRYLTKKDLTVAEKEIEKRLFKKIDKLFEGMHKQLEKIDHKKRKKHKS